MHSLPARLAALPLASLLLLGGCNATDPYTRPGEWHPLGANAANLRAMIADPRDLDQGQGATLAEGDIAAAAVARLRADAVKRLPASSVSSVQVSDTGAAGGSSGAASAATAGGAPAGAGGGQ